MQQQRSIRRKELAVVGEHAQPIPIDFGVRRVDVHHLDAPRRERFIRETMIESARSEGKP